MPAKKLKVAYSYINSAVSIRRSPAGSMIRINLREATPQQLKFLYDMGHPSVEEASPPKKTIED